MSKRHRVSSVKAWREPRTPEELAKAVFLFLDDSLGLIGCSSRGKNGGNTCVDSQYLNCDVTITNREHEDGEAWYRLDAKDHKHLKEWCQHGRPEIAWDEPAQAEPEPSVVYVGTPLERLLEAALEMYDDAEGRVSRSCVDKILHTVVMLANDEPTDRIPLGTLAVKFRGRTILIDSADGVDGGERVHVIDDGDISNLGEEVGPKFEPAAN